MMDASTSRPGGEPESMHYSGILVVVEPSRMSDAAAALESLPGVEVHYRDRERGRLIVVQETTTAEEQQEGLRRIQALPPVWMAALVEHRIEPMTEESRGERS